MSTIGEHLLSPDCELTDLRPADVMYQKQIAYVLLPYIAYFTSWVLWLIVSCRRRKWSSGEPSYQDKHIATVVFLLYLLYPTMCSASFALLSSKEVNGRSFLHADLQEPFMEGRHLLYVLFLTVPQLIFVVGLPVVGFVVLRRHQKAHTLHKTRTQFRYGMLYSGYQYKRWWWDLVVAYRKLAIAFVTSYAPDTVEIHILLFILTLALFLNTQWRPYTDEEAIDKKERQSLHDVGAYSTLMVYATAWSGFFFKLWPHCEKDSWSCMALVIIVAVLNAGFFIYCILTLAYATCRERMPDIVACKKRVTKRCKRPAKPIALTNTTVNPIGETSFNNPMYRMRRTSTIHSRMASRNDIEMSNVLAALGRSESE